MNNNILERMFEECRQYLEDFCYEPISTYNKNINNHHVGIARSRLFGAIEFARRANFISWSDADDYQRRVYEEFKYSYEE